MKRRYTLFKRSGQKYWYVYVIENGKRVARSTGCTKKYQAQQYAEDFSRSQPLYQGTLKEYADGFFNWETSEWIKRRHARDKSFSRSTALLREGQLKNYILPAFGNIPLSDLNTVHIDNWISSLPLSNQSKNHILYTFNIILKEAKREKCILENPLDEVERMGVTYKKRDSLTLNDIKQLFPDDKSKLLQIWEHLKWATAYYTMLTTGMRTGEVSALRWCDILWDIPGILILRAVTADNAIGETKAKEKRGVLIPKRTKDLLSWWRTECLFVADEHYVFHSYRGNQYINPKTLGRKMSGALKRAQIDKSNRNITAHSLRHTYNTRMRTVLPEAILRFMIGHKSEAMTDRYDQAEPEERLRALSVGQELNVNTVWK